MKFIIELTFTKQRWVLVMAIKYKIHDCKSKFYGSIFK